MNGVVLPQVVLSAVMTPGDLLVGTGFMQGDGIDGRTVPYREFWVYPLI